MKKLIFICYLLASVQAFSQEVEFNPSTSVLIIPQVKIDTNYVYSAKLKYTGGNNFVLQEYSTTPPISNTTNVSSDCSNTPITREKMLAINENMTLDQVNNTLGCSGKEGSINSDRIFYEWIGLRSPEFGYIKGQISRITGKAFNFSYSSYPNY
ncbi:MAG: hypothetical protein HOP02_14965 [Methylococcaceae bacterium]|nr:hypothetical protein [Methylococcaceae bacterium]